MLRHSRHLLLTVSAAAILAGAGCKRHRLEKTQSPEMPGPPAVEHPTPPAADPPPPLDNPPAVLAQLDLPVLPVEALLPTYVPPPQMALDIATLYGLRCPSSTRTAYLEAEDFDGAWSVHTPYAGFSGRGVVMPVSDTGSTITTAMSAIVPVTAAGHYRVWARAFEGGDTERAWQIAINRMSLEAIHTSIYGDRFSWKLAGEIDLEAGDARLDLVPLGHPDTAADAVILSADPACDPSAVDLEWDVLEPSKAGSMIFDHINLRARQYSGSVPVPETVADWMARSDALRQRVLATLALSPLPDRTPLRAQVHGQTQMDGYRIERVTFESLPGLVVTANVYVPDGRGPFPIVLNPGGHWPDGKALATTVARGQSLAQLGYIALAYDPFGFGERSTDGNGHEAHFNLSLSGRSNATIAIWESMRAIDYLVSRPDTDPTRIAVTGESGGGLNTVYLSAVDPRLKAVAPVVYMTSFRELIATGVPHDPCTHVPGLAQYTDMGEVGALFAPRPQLVMNAALDTAFTPSGVKHAEAEARPIYDLFGADGRLGVTIFPGEHEYSQPMREAFYGFAAQSLLATSAGEPVPEPSAVTIPPDSPILACFDDALIPPTDIHVKYYAEQWAVAAARSLPSPSAIDAASVRSALLRAVGPPSPADPPLLEMRGSVSVGRMRAYKLSISVEPEIALAALYVPATSAGAPVVMIVDDAGNGKQLLLNDVRNAGFAAFYVSPRGRGETAWEEYMVLTDNMLLGDSTLGQRAFDLVAARRALRQIPDLAGVPVGVLAVGDTAGLEALFAQALYNEFDAVSAGPTIASFLEAFEPSGLPEPAYVAGVLLAGDVAHAAQIASARPLRLTLRSDVMAKREPDWAAALTRSGVIQSEAGVGAALVWLKARLTR